MPKLTTAAEARPIATPMRVVVVTMDNHLASATQRPPGRRRIVPVSPVPIAAGYAP